MALDAATLALTAAELKTTLADAKIAKLFEPTRDELFTMAPLPCFFISTSSYFIQFHTPRRLTEITRSKSQPSVSARSSRTAACMPTLL